MPSTEIENLVIKRIKEIAFQDNLLEALIDKTNEKMKKELPRMLNQKRILEDELKKIKDSADLILTKWTDATLDLADEFIKEKLDKLAERKGQLHDTLDTLRTMIEDIERNSIEKKIIQKALNEFNKVINTLPSYRQRDLFQLVIKKVSISEKKMEMALYGKPAKTNKLNIEADAEPWFAQTLDWLPGTDSNHRQGGYRISYDFS
ncbi:MAG: hypothetical protein KKA19_08175 [Candidatus Margulisbacteria bacterium]|nr:hypothetical protein [Candidatus Margulisiibacteriota bacterium]